MKFSNTSSITVPVALLLAASGCANMQGLGSGLLSSTGMVSSSQADALIGAGTSLYKATETLSPEQEHYLGRGVSARILAKYQPLRNKSLNDYVNRVGKALVVVSDRPETFSGYHFQVLDSNELNAFAAPGGFIFVTKGLIAAVPDEDCLAGVLAHEIGHIVAEDGMKAISSGHLTNALAILGKQAASDALASHGAGELSQLTDVFGGSIEDVFKTMVTNGYSRSQEYAADKYGAELLKRAGYNSSAMVTLMDRLAQSHATGGMLHTHPSPADRRDELEDIVGKTAQVTEDQKLRSRRFLSAVASAGVHPVS